MSLEGNLQALFYSINEVLNFSFPLFQYDISIYEILFFILILSFFSALFGINLVGGVDSYVDTSKQPTRDARIRANYEKRQKMIRDYRESQKIQSFREHSNSTLNKIRKK